MRKLLWFTVGFGLFVALYAYCVSEYLLLVMAGCLLALGVGVIFLPKTVNRVLMVVMIGVLAGMIYSQGYDRFLLADVKQYDGVEAAVSVEATDYGYATGYGYAVDGKVTLNNRSYRIRLYYNDLEGVKPGDILAGAVTFRYTPEGGSKQSTYHKAEGIFLLGYAEADIKYLPCKTVPGAYFASQLRYDIAKMIDQIFPDPTAAFAKALLLGDDSDISFQDNLSFQRSGIRHVVAVSGLHVSILFAVLYYLTGRKKFLTVLLGLPLLFLFAAVAGFTPSVVRACIMQALVILAVALEREYDPGTALSFAALCMLIANPLTITSVSFQLSIGCMVGIFAFSAPIRQYLFGEKCLGPGKGKSFQAKLKRWFVGSVSVSVSAMSLTLPLCAVYFGAVSVVGILTNLAVLWLVTYIFMGIILVCILGWIWMPLGAAVAYPVSYAIGFVIWVANLFGKIPFGNLYTHSPYTIVWIVMTIMMLAVFLLCKKRPVKLFATAVIVFYMLAAIAPWSEPYWGDYIVSVLDVGQGQCVVLQSKDKVYLVDCGGSHGEEAATVALNTLESRGIKMLDGIILTHYDEDHCNGVGYVMDRMPVQMLYLPDGMAHNEIRLELRKRDTPITWVDENLSLTCGEAGITIYPGEKQNMDNESSMCILFQGENCDILITGDRNIAGERALLEKWEIPDLEVLVVGHHGASTSTGTDLLNKTKPEIAVISVGENNRYRHPNQEILDRLNQMGCIIRRTDLEGTIIIRG